MGRVKGTETEKNLLKSFAGESQARNRYTYAAKVANKEGFPQIEQIFLETADQERVHAKSMFKHLEGGKHPSWSRSNYCKVILFRFRSF